MNTPLVSIVVPVYNSKAYFEATLRSLIEQTYTNTEIILVNDGCTDSTPEIIEKYKDTDSRIVVLNKVNEGTQYARRDGVNIARGEYVKTMDCDDILLPDAVERLVARAIETGADMVAAPFIFDREDKESFASTPLQFDIISGIDYFKEVCYKRAYWPTWTTLHKRSLYRDNNIALDPDIMLTEDTILTTQLALYSHTVAAIHQPIVHFKVHSDSLSHNNTISDVQYHDLRKYPLWIANFVQKHGYGDALKKELAFLLIRVTFESFAKNRFESTTKDIKNIIRILREFPELRAELSIRERKIVDTYRVSTLLGRLNVYRYNKQGKI